MENKLVESNLLCGIITLTPKAFILPLLKEVYFDEFNIFEGFFDKYINETTLHSHAVPVRVPLFFNMNELSTYIEANTETLINLMLTAWPVPLTAWPIFKKNIELFDKLVDARYYPITGEAIAKEVITSLDLAVTLAKPTEELTNYLVDYCASKKAILGEQEFSRIAFLVGTGIGIITNKLERGENQEMMKYIQATNDSRNYLTLLKGRIVQTLFSYYFQSPSDYPKEIDDIFLNKWFDIQTLTGICIP